jgi:hypothetical protein
MIPENPLIISYAVTDDTPDSLPWPPVGDAFCWCAIKQERGRTTWRRVALRATPNERPIEV